MRTVAWIVAALMMGTSAGCMGPRPPLPPDSRIPLTQVWRDGSRVEETTVDTRWWREFDDPTLDSLVELAIRQNDDQQIAIARVAEARAAVRLTRATLLPHLDLQATGVREAGISPLGLPNQQTAGELSSLITYDADIFGRLQSEHAAAKALLSEAEASRDNIGLSVASAAAASYISLRALDARLQIVESTLTLRKESLQVAQRRYSAGYSTALDLEQARAEYLSTQQRVPELHEAIARQENAFSALMSKPPGAIPRGTSLEHLQAPTLPHTLPSTVVRQRPDIYAAEQHLMAADYTLSAARASFLPNILLEAGAGRAFSTLYPEPITLWSVGGSILAPIFAGGALHARQDIAAARRDQAAFAYRGAVLTAFREVENEMTAIRETGDRIQILLAQEEAFASASRLATRRYRTGYSSYLDQLDAERGLLDAQLAVVQMKANYLLAFVDLFRAIGGGWEPPDSNKDIHVPVDSSK